MRSACLAAALAVVASGCAPAEPAPHGPGIHEGVVRGDPVADGSLADGSLALAGEAWVRDDTLRAALRLTNTGERPVRVGFGACSARIVGWADAARPGRPVITTAASRSADGVAYGCPAYLATRQLGPGETATADDTRELRVARALAEVLGDDAPDGRYWLSATFRVSELGGGRGEDTLRVDLNPLDLEFDRPPLAAEVLRMGVRFRVDSARVERGRLRAVVRAVPVPSLGPDVVGWAPCAVRVLAFADAARRDAAPRAGPAAATADAACGQPDPVPFESPVADRDEPPFFLSIERTLRAEVDVPLADLLGGRPAGSYALAVAVRTVGRPGYDVGALPPVYLSFGEVGWAP